MRRVSGAMLMLAVMAMAPAARAQNIIDRWTQIFAPPAPALDSVAVDPKTTALLVLDFVTQTCNRAHRPRCVASVPAERQLLEAARAHHATVIYSYVPSGTSADVLPALKPEPGEAIVQSGPDKFLHTDLEAILRRDGVETVIVTGTAAEGAVLSTASEAAFRGFQVVVPVDVISSSEFYPEQYVVWDLLHSPGTAGRVRITTTDRITFR